MFDIYKMTFPAKTNQIPAPSMSVSRNSSTIESKSGTKNDILWIIVGAVIVVSVVFILTNKPKTTSVHEYEY